MKAIRTNDNSNPTIEIRNEGSLGKTLLAGGVGAVAGGAAVFGALKGPELIKMLKEKREAKKAGKDQNKDTSQGAAKEAKSDKPSSPVDSGSQAGAVDPKASEASKPATPETHS